MSLPKIFFSYSRLDSDFALRLAKDIRKAGADIWIDQLDIPAGQHWDAAVEKALLSSSCVLVILSPASTASNNVKDEISFALDTGKKIIPVLLEECMAPFRLRRLQHIDFSKAYAEGLKQLLAAIKRSSIAAPKVAQPVMADGDEDFPSERDAAEPQTEEEIQESQLWHEACRINTVISYQGYLQETVIGEFKDEARLMINQLQIEEKEDELEILLWQKAKSDQSINLLHHYLKEYPEGRYSKLALEALENLDKQERLDHHHTKITSPEAISTPKSPKKLFTNPMFIFLAGVILIGILWGFVASINAPQDQEEKAWKDVSLNHNIASLHQFLNTWPDGKYSSAAKYILDSLQSQEANKMDSLKLVTTTDSLGSPPETTVVTILDTIKKTVTTPKQKTIPVAKKAESKFKIGQQYQGGIIVSVDATGNHGVIVSDKELGALEYGVAVKKCASWKANGYDDWRLPTKDELNLMFKSRKVMGMYSKGMYWSSTDVSTDIVWTQNLYDGHPGNFNKQLSCFTRPVRNF